LELIKTFPLLFHSLSSVEDKKKMEDELSPLTEDYEYYYTTDKKKRKRTTALTF